MKAISWAIVLAVLILKKEKNELELFGLGFAVGSLFFSMATMP